MKELISDNSNNEVLRIRADEVRRKYYGNRVFVRGLIEISNICKNDCYYCGIRKSNRNISRYRLTEEEIYSCCETGYNLGFRTFVLQGGEDLYFSDIVLCRIVNNIKNKYPDCAVTLSMGERSYESYKNLKSAGADRYLLRHETADNTHYSKLHPAGMSLENRKKCLYNLKSLGYQTGTGFMVGSPYQTVENIISDLRFMQEIQPEMIGIGVFIPHHDTPFRDYPHGSAELNIKLISIIRLMFPKALIPATTALGTVSPDGRERGIQAGCNVVMPNLSPLMFRKSYELYDNKICTGEESAQCIECLRKRVESVGYELDMSRGDYPDV
ncbi:MAG: [FeFe] hydrogenase H-cluster radical SAM maturase HydE [Oscillospiraceae bacterium]|nr:[FeFe] hydrogenase H-cluster radical SAM maturase HydE [Oscillospiraceae bacterium]